VGLLIDHLFAPQFPKALGLSLPAIVIGLDMLDACFGFLHAGGGQRLLGARMLAAVRCAPPQNKPTPQERDTCAPWFRGEVERVARTARAAVALGAFAWQAAPPALVAAGYRTPSRRPAFRHGVEVELGDPDGRRLLLLGCYHPSQQNTFTGKLTEQMLDEILQRAVSYAGAASG